MKKSYVATGLILLLASIDQQASFAQTISYPDFCDLSDFTLNGDAGIISNPVNCTLRLVDSA